jgi:hypothetical protein
MRVCGSEGVRERGKRGGGGRGEGGERANEGGRACRQKGWWKRGDMEAKLNTVNMMAWVHKECDIIEEALTKLQEAWDSAEHTDECTVCLDDLKRAYQNHSTSTLSSKPLDKHSTPIDRHYKQEVMTEGSIRKVYRIRMDSLDVVSVY